MTTNPYKINTKIYDLFELIKNENELEHLLIDDSDSLYECNIEYYSSGFTHLHKCVIMTKKFTFLNEYIDEYLNLYPEEIDVKNNLGFTALMLSVVNSNNNSSNKTVKILLKHGANINVKDNCGCTPLINSVCSSKDYITDKTIEILLNNNADINIQDNYGNTAIMHITDCDTFYRSIEIAKILMKYNPNIDLKNKRGNNVVERIFLYSALINNKSIINILLPNRKIFIDKVNVNKETIIKYANYWKLEMWDLKITNTLINSFEKIITNM